MINDPQKIFQEFTPGGFTKEKFNKVKQKTLNELNNKYRYLKNMEYHLNKFNESEEDDMKDFYPILKKFINNYELLSYVKKQN